MVLSCFQYILPLLTLLLGAFISRRKNQAEIDKLVINNVQDIVKIYKTAVDDLKAEVHGLREEVKLLRQRLNIQSS